MKILLVEDDQATGELVSTTLAANRYAVDIAADGALALEFTEVWKYDLILLDVSLPKLDGIQVCRNIRAKGSNIPILMLTARGSDQDVIRGLDAGADDYVVKPCNLDQLLARIRSLLRRSSDISAPILQWCGLSLDPVASRVMYQQQEITLRPKEYALLELFLRHPQRIFSRSAILDHLWTVDNFPSEGAVTNLIKDLRHRLMSVGLPQDLVETVHGLGYRLKTIASEVAPASEESSVETSRAQVESGSLERLQERLQGQVKQRLSLLEESAQLLPAGNLSEEHRQRVQQEVHRLAGSLGMYGYGRASEIARSLDRLLAKDLTTVHNQADQFAQWLSELRQELVQPPGSPPQSTVLQSTAAPPSPLLLAISEDDQWAEALQQEARNWHWRVEVIPDWSPAQQQFVLETPALVIIELRGMFDQQRCCNQQELETLRQVKQRFPEVPAFMLAEQDDLLGRVVTSRLGSERYFTKPMLPAQLFAAIAQWFSQSHPSPARVLIVDDDPAIHPFLTRLLQPWGLEVVSLEQPEQFWQVLTQTNPDLVIIDIEMPNFNGIELCRVMRQDTQYSELPILVITAHTELDFVRQVFEAGANDLLYKPIVDSEFVARVMSQIERWRSRLPRESYLRPQPNPFHYQPRIWQQEMTDVRTPIASRWAFHQFLQQSWQRHQTEKLPLTLILCDVDELTLYRECYGASAGNACLQQIVSTIQQCIKPGVDQIAHYGNAKFAILLPETTLGGAIKVVERIQQSVACLKIPHSEAAIHPYLTLSLGITGAIPTPEKLTDQLLAMAERSLDAAKKQGRNTYCLLPL